MPGLDVEDEIQRFASNGLRLSDGMDELAHLLVARPREAELARQSSDSAVRLGDRSALVVEAGDRRRKTLVETWRLFGHRHQCVPGMAKRSARNCSNFGPITLDAAVARVRLLVPLWRAGAAVGVFPEARSAPPRM